MNIPGNEKDLKFDQFIQGLNLEDDQAYQFHPKTSGTSIGFKVSKIGKRKKGLFLPPNSATNPEGEVTSYRLSRFLGVSHFYNPADYYTIESSAIRRFEPLLRDDERNKWRKKNTLAVRSMISKSPSSMFGVYKFRHKRDSQSVNTLVKGNRFNVSHHFASLIRAKGPMPTNDLVSFDEVRSEKPEYPNPQEKEIILASQLSSIFVIDALLGQWDRFSGGNIEAYAHKDGILQLVGRDNGGANILWGRSWYNRYLKWVTRFDQKTIKELEDMNLFCKGIASQYKGFTDSREFGSSLGFRSSRAYRKFTERLDHFLSDHVDSIERRYGDKTYFNSLTEPILT